MSIKVGIICPSEIAFRRFLPSLQLVKEFNFAGVAVASPEEWAGDGKVTEAKKGKTGWHDGTYWVYPSTTLSTKATQITYTISGAEWNKRGYPTKQLNQTVMGIDFHFNDATKLKDNNTIYLNWVKIVVSSSFNKEKIKEWKKLNVPVDLYGVGTSFVNNMTCGFTRDLVMLDGKGEAKEGRANYPSTRLKKVPYPIY